MRKEIKPGLYRHYKGKDYQVYEVARHSETEELFVVYRCLYGNYDLWVRPLAMFTEMVETSPNNMQPRFKFIASNEEEINN
ncbi:MAG: DUF1653 domain-containing protein [Cellvibrionaceae bacterium]